jgi:hypothetical protein
LNYVQAWALDYWIAMERRVHVEDKHAELEEQTYNLFPERWARLYRDEMLPVPSGDIGHAFEPGTPEIPVTDANDLDDWYSRMEQPRRMSGQSAINYGGDNIFGYAEGQGRRV